MERKPVVIGIGGLLERGERGKVTDMLDILGTQYRCRTYEITFANIRRDGDTIICSINQGDSYNVGNTLDLAVSEIDNDPSRIGVITSSMGVVPLIEYLSQKRDNIAKFVAHAANVPFTRINPLARKYVEGIMEKGHSLDISSKFDTERKQKRIIPSTDLQYILDFDANKLVSEISDEHQMRNLTILASRDERVDNEETIKLHNKLKGKESDIVRVNSDHCVPYELSRKPIMEFMVEALDLKQQ